MHAVQVQAHRRREDGRAARAQGDSGQVRSHHHGHADVAGTRSCSTAPTSTTARRCGGVQHRTVSSRSNATSQPRRSTRSFRRSSASAATPSASAAACPITSRASARSSSAGSRSAPTTRRRPTGSRPTPRSARSAWPRSRRTAAAMCVRAAPLLGRRSCSVELLADTCAQHMTCKKCKYEFCWVCMGEWSAHGTSWYSCNRCVASLTHR